jgi:HK97 family phage major capsid protein
LPQGYQSQNSAHSLYMPTTIRAAGLDSGTATKGAELKFVQYGGFIDMLRNKARVIQAGATMLSGLSGPVTFTKQNGAGTFSWLAENGGADAAESNLLLTTVTLTPKTGQSTTSFSRQLLRQAVEDIEQIVRNDLAAIHAIGVDLASLSGTGAGNQPTGVKNTSGVGVVALGTNGLAPTYASVINQQVQIGQANADEDIGAGAYITTPGLKGTLQTTQKFATTNGDPIWNDQDIIAGRKGFSTNQVESNLTKGSGTNLHAMYYGIWQQLLIGEWGVMEILTDPLRLKKQGMIEVTSFQMIDIAVRYAGAFSKIVDAISTF